MAANSLAQFLSDRSNFAQYSPDMQNHLRALADKQDASMQTIVGNGDQAYGVGGGNVTPLLQSQNQLPAVSGQQQMQPMNTLRNNMTGASYEFKPMPQGPALDYSKPEIEIARFGKGRYLQGDPFTVMLDDGRRVSLGRDSAADIARMKEDLSIAALRQKLQEGDVDIKTKQVMLAQGGRTPIPSGYRLKTDGTMEPIPGGPADLKAQAAAQQKATGATDVDLAVSTLRDAYGRLEKGGGITSTQNGPIDNLEAAVSSSGVGQAVGKMFGTQNQSARNDIAMTRPALLAALMKATGMSAKQMDSNAELKLWLSTATDPTLDVESNRRALNNIERKYLGGQTQNPETQQPAQQNARIPQVGTVMQGHRFRGGNPADPSSWERVQ